MPPSLLRPLPCVRACVCIPLYYTPTVPVPMPMLVILYLRKSAVTPVEYLGVRNDLPHVSQQAIAAGVAVRRRRRHRAPHRRGAEKGHTKPKENTRQNGETEEGKRFDKPPPYINRHADTRLRFCALSPARAAGSKSTTCNMRQPLIPSRPSRVQLNSALSTLCELQLLVQATPSTAEPSTRRRFRR